MTKKNMPSRKNVQYFLLYKAIYVSNVFHFKAFIDKKQSKWKHLERREAA